MSRIVIVGAGVAGVSAAGAARAGGWDGGIVLIGEEAGLPYRRPPVSKEVVRGEKTVDEIRIKPATWYEKQNVELRDGVAVTSIDTTARRVRLSDGQDLTYDKLILATGGRARVLPNLPAGVITLRRADDVAALQKHLDQNDPIIVVGAGLIGSEIAASARQAGSPVTLLESAGQPLPRVLPTDLAEMYAQLHTEQGCELHTGVAVTDIVGSDSGGLTVTSVDGRSWQAPVVVLSVGMIPNVELAEAAGIEIDPEFGGILVDEWGRTNVPDVYAAGDVAAMPNLVLGGRQRVEHWQNAQNHGAAVGRVAAGQDTTFAEVPWAWSDQYGHNLQITGWPQSNHDVVIRGSVAERDFAAFYLDDGVVRGVIGIGRPRDIRAGRAWIGESVRVDAKRLADESTPLDQAVDA